MRYVRQFLCGIHDTTMLLTLVLWFCLLPIVLLLSLPFFGWAGAIRGAALTLVLALVLCWGVCLFPTISTPAPIKTLALESESTGNFQRRTSKRRKRRE